LDAITDLFVQRLRVPYREVLQSFFSHDSEKEEHPRDSCHLNLWMTSQKVAWQKCKF